VPPVRPATPASHPHPCPLSHGDLKPCNVLLKAAPATPADPRGAVAKVADFGLARFVGCDHVTTATHGSIAYQAPEVLVTRRVGLPADVFSFGVLAAEVLTGVKAFKGLSIGRIVHAVVVEGRRPALPARVVPALLAALVAACLAREPGDRPGFGDIRVALRGMLEDGVWREVGGVEE